ncbi:Integrase, catalytic core protein [Phytophthora megakarya]|uniref:Integrase, catalytic core protein n=1 Tax=Phytophthora megakarya TaxID=4795 RepID=A0A225VC11_9STRA|nr:Integrase, catalytic core protein [Phytophthora megakarya]
MVIQNPEQEAREDRREAGCVRPEASGRDEDRRTTAAGDGSRVLVDVPDCEHGSESQIEVDRGLIATADRRSQDKALVAWPNGYIGSRPNKFPAIGSGKHIKEGARAPRVWNKTLHKFLTSIGLERLDSDYGLYARKVGGEVTMLLTVYVDDLLLMGPSDLCAKVAKQLSAEYELTELGPVKYLLGVEILIDRQRRHVIFCQRQYISEVLKRFHMDGCNSVATPEALRAEVVKPTKDSEDPPYREIVGALQYLASASRPDIAHAVRTLSKYLSCYDHSHYAMAKRVLRYLAGTTDYGLVMDIEAGNEVELVCYTDADYANDLVDRKSVSGFVTFVNGNVVSYGSRKEEINARSTTEAELGDKKSSIYLTAKPGKHGKMKHIQNKYHLGRHLVEESKLQTRNVGTRDMIADALTKSLSKDKPERCRDGMKVLRINQVQTVTRSVGAKGGRRAITKD